VGSEGRVQFAQDGKGKEILFKDEKEEVQDGLPQVGGDAEDHAVEEVVGGNDEPKHNVRRSEQVMGEVHKGLERPSHNSNDGSLGERKEEEREGERERGRTRERRRRRRREEKETRRGRVRGKECEYTCDLQYKHPHHAATIEARGRRRCIN